MNTGWRWLGGIGFAAVAVVYAVTFSDRPVVLDRVDVVADADAARYAQLLREYTPGRNFDDGSRPGEITQAQKLKHSLFAITGTVLWRAARLFGAAAPLDVFLPNAVISAANLLLFVLLLRACGVPLPVAAPIVVMYGVAASPWIIGALPESWPLTGTITLVVLLLLRGFDGRYRAWCGPLVGLGMLNDPLLVLLLGIVAAEEWRRSGWTRDTARRMVIACAAGAAVFLGGLSALSLADPAYRPDRYLATFRGYVERRPALLAARGETGPWTRHAVGNGVATALVSSVVTDHAIPGQLTSLVPLTWQAGIPGKAGLLAYAGLIIAAAAAVVLRRRGPATWRDDAWPLLLALAVYLAVSGLLNQRMFWIAGLLYGPSTVPILLLMVALALHALPAPVARALWIPAAVIAACNVHNILRMRDLLAALS